jgi:TonB family protein
MPLIASQRITLPVPDLSQPSASNEQLEATAAADQTLVPNYLTANLTAVSLSDDHGADDQRVDSVENPVAESVEADIEQSAQPQIEMQRFLTNSQLPPCAVTPEAVYFLGKTVAMRVTTDAEGQVMQTVTEKSSQNLAYDELASCLVKNWSFKPAIAHGQPAKSDGLVVQITIDRN